MHSFRYARGTIALCCVAILLLAGLIPAAHDLPFAVLAQACLFVIVLVTLAVCRHAIDCDVPMAPVCSPVCDRAPPVR